MHQREEPPEGEYSQIDIETAKQLHLIDEIEKRIWKRTGLKTDYQMSISFLVI